MVHSRQRITPLPNALAGALLTTIWLGGVAPVGAQSVSSSELEGLRRELAREEGRLDEGRAERRTVEAELQQTEQDATVVIRRLRQLEASLAERTAELAVSTRERELGAARSAAARAALAGEVRSSYIVGRADHLKMLLNQENPRRVSRAVALHGFVARSRAARVDDLVASLHALRETERRLAAEAQELEILTRRTAAARAELDARRVHRAGLLARLDEELRDSAARIERLRRNEAELVRLLDQVARAPAPPPPRALTGSERPTFDSLSGTLPWPTRGRLVAGFGTTRSSGELKWTGIRIDAPIGESVRAVAGGRVAWSDWLRGFGQLIIIDHGDGWMSLYGHVRELLRERGDWVEAGDLLGTVGDSGGQSRSGLYFEIRKDGRPRNPSRWFADRRPAAAPPPGRA